MEREKKEKMHARKRACRKYTSLAFLILRGPFLRGVPPSFMNGKKEKSRPRERRLRSKVRYCAIVRRFESDLARAIFQAGSSGGGGGGDYGFDNETRSRN